MKDVDDPIRPPRTMPKRRRPTVAGVIIPGLAVLSGGMLAMAVPNLIGDGGAFDLVKAGAIGVSGGLVAWGTNYLAIERGAPLATVQMPGAALLSTVSMLAVGAGLFTATYSGLVLEDVERRRLEEHGAAYARFVDARSQRAAEAERAAPVVDAIAGDLLVKTSCEAATSCVSGRGSGTGRVYRTLQGLAQRAQLIAEQADAGTIRRERAVENLNVLLGRYEAAFANAELDRTELRAALKSIDAELGQGVSDLDAAAVTPLLRAYADELREGVSIPARPEATRAVNELLASHGTVLDRVVETVDTGDQTRPSFPAKTGVADTFAYVGTFLPVAAIVGVIELIFAPALWLYTFMTLRWQRHRDDPPPPDNEPEGGSFAGLVSLRPLDAPPLASLPKPRPRRRIEARQKRR